MTMELCTLFKKVAVLSAVFLACLTHASLAEDFPFPGQVNSDNINIRIDTTVNSAAICSVNKGDTLQVLDELYGEWYKVGLPKAAPAYVSSALVVVQDAKTARIIKYAVNIRLGPSEKSPIIGKIDIAKTVNVRQDLGDWIKIEPPENCYGWIHKKFVDKLTATPPKPKPVQREGGPEVYEGKLETYGRAVKYSDTLKFTSDDGKAFLMTGDRRDLEALNYHRVRITVLKMVTQRRGYPIIYPQKIEVLD